VHIPVVAAAIVHRPTPRNEGLGAARLAPRPWHSAAAGKGRGQRSPPSPVAGLRPVMGTATPPPPWPWPCPELSPPRFSLRDFGVWWQHWGKANVLLCGRSIRKRAHTHAYTYPRLHAPVCS